MSTEVYEDERAHRIEWNQRIDAPEFTWTEYVTGEEFRSSLVSLHEAIAAEGADRYLVDTREITAHDDEDKRWIAETWIPDLVDDGVRYGAGIYPDSAIAEMDMEKIEDQVNQISEQFTFRAFRGRDEAVAWLSEQ